MRFPPPLTVEPEVAQVLRGWVEDGAVGPAAVRRARIVLLSASGLGPAAVAAELGCSKQTVITWRERFRAAGVAGLRDAPRSGRPVTVDAFAVIARTLEGPPERLRAARWSSRLLAAETGISNVAVAKVWRSWGVVPSAGGARLATEPVLDVPPAGVAGVHLDPPLRLLAVLVNGSGPVRAPAVPVGQRPDPGSCLDDVDTGGPRGGDGLAAFLGRLEALGPHGLGLLVEPGHRAVREWAAARPGVVLHVVPPALSWSRLARVAGVLAGASVRGAATVDQLCRAASAHTGGGPFSWTADGLVDTCV